MSTIIRRDSRETFAATAADLVRTDPRTAIVYAEISGQYFGDVAGDVPERVINVGIREQLLVSVGAGLALSGLRPIVHTFASFLVERPFEQVKLDFGHQDVGGVLVSTGGAFDVSSGGRTHQSPGDVALMGTLPGWSIHLPGHADEVEAVLRRVVPGEGRHYVRVVGQQNERPSEHVVSGRPGFEVVRRGAGGVVIAVGPTLTETLAATEDLDVTVLYAVSIRPFDAHGLRAAVAQSAANVVLVEPYLAGTTSAPVSAALIDVPHRLLALGTRNVELRHYGTPSEHIRAHGLDAPSLRQSIGDFLTRGA